MLKVYRRYTGQKPAEVIDHLSLPFDLRKRGRFKAVTESGRDIGLFIERGQVLADGELLWTECGQLVQVIAEPETVVTASSDDWLQFAKVCYHLGNRHVPLQVGERWLRFQPDHVLQDLAELYGLNTIIEQAPFAPENGAYGAHSGHSHGEHEHSHDHGNDHSHTHKQNPSQEHNLNDGTGSHSHNTHSDHSHSH
ncbi:MAG: urease accessory protein UreE [Motiliproteus sp.]